MQRIAIVGLGIMGMNHYNTLKKMNDVEIVGLCDIEKKEGLDGEFFTDVKEMLTSLKPDGVIIAAPTFLHKDIALECAKQKVDIFLEKPAASTIEDAKEILKVVEENKIKSCVGHIERFNPVVNTLIDHIKDHEILSISITRSGSFPQRIADVGILTDLSVHDSDLIRFITKKDIIRSAVFKSQKIHKTHEDNAILAFELEGEVVGNISTNWFTPYRKRSIDVACRVNKESNIKYFEADLILQTLKERINIDASSHITKECFVHRYDALYKELSTFINYLETGERGSLATVKDSIITLEIANDS
jgi:predicted dehydrogenase